ncbi:hyaluronoglucosaminidase [Oesophagostomum dentatum]|uniref:Hyaluronidase n=1 Tax=Oesophagostomum dentatum TaxID=61180 RepID=A0A0B1TFA2_OESDE|nr:hyaluronoglucosaminidase [Oesophagostomum dentatum]
MICYDLSAVFENMLVENPSFAMRLMGNVESDALRSSFRQFPSIAELVSDLSFHGEHIATFYEFSFGRYPHYKDYNASWPIYGGLPQVTLWSCLIMYCSKKHFQNTSINDHLHTARFNITNRTKANFRRLGIIDFEEWRPLFDQNGWREKQVFQNQSKILAQERYPNITNQTEIEDLAVKEFNEKAKDFFVATIKLAKKIRPKTKWGFYGFPYCNYNAGRNDKYECDQKYKDWNENMMFIFNESTALFPSIYLNSDLSITSEQRRRYIHAILKEARRISKKYNPPLPIYAYTKIEYNPKVEPDKFYNNDGEEHHRSA